MTLLERDRIIFEEGKEEKAQMAKKIKKSPNSTIKAI